MQRKKKILIIGFGGSGKTHFLRMIQGLADKNTRIEFSDLDQLIEAQIQEEIFHFVGSNGWESFRKIENKLFNQELNNEKVQILALGGGTIIDQNRISYQLGDMMVIWLNVSFPTCLIRIKNDSIHRPLSQLSEMDLHQIYHNRISQYKDWSTHELKDPNESELREMALYILNYLR